MHLVKISGAVFWWHPAVAQARVRFSEEYAVYVDPHFYLFPGFGFLFVNFFAILAQAACVTA